MLNLTNIQQVDQQQIPACRRQHKHCNGGLACTCTCIIMYLHVYLHVIVYPYYTHQSILSTVHIIITVSHIHVVLSVDYEN